MRDRRQGRRESPQSNGSGPEPWIETYQTQSSHRVPPATITAREIRFHREGPCRPRVKRWIYVLAVLRGTRAPGSGELVPLGSQVIGAAGDIEHTRMIARRVV